MSVGGLLFQMHGVTSTVGSWAIATVVTVTALGTASAVVLAR